MLTPSTPRVVVYLSGNVRKGTEDPRPATDFWSLEDERRLADEIKASFAEIINPATSHIQKYDFKAIFGADLDAISKSDILLVDGRGSRGVGVGAEMMYAHSKDVAVITICPPNSFYRRDVVRNVQGEDLHEWIHPFIGSLSDFIVDDIGQAISTINNLVIEGCPKRALDVAADSIEHFHRLEHSRLRGIVENAPPK
jgi:hypothetical protein